METEKTKSVIAEANSMLRNILHDGFDIKDISEIACMIRDMQTVEAYIKEMHYPEQRMETGELSRLLKNAEDELHAAEKYHKWWMETSDASLKAIGRDELRHAETLLKQARAKTAAPESNASLQELTSWYQVLMGKLV